MNIQIIGAGCVGCILAERLNKLGVKPNFIAKGNLAKQIKENGIIVNNKKYNIPISNSKADLIIVCVKNYDLEQACIDMKECVCRKTIILPLLNGISATKRIEAIYPNNKVLYGYITKINSYRDKNGYKYSIPGEIHFGYSNNKKVSQELKDIQQIFFNAGFNTYIDEDMIKGIWRKWMLNVGANQVSALTEANYLEFSRILEIKELLKMSMKEILTIAKYEKVSLNENDLNEVLEYLTTYTLTKKTSMLQDVQNHTKTEVNYFSGEVIKLSRKWNCNCPVNTTMYYLIKSKEKIYLQSKN